MKRAAGESKRKIKRTAIENESIIIKKKRLGVDIGAVLF